jgi:serine/threonine protein phosphatase 1
MPSWTPAPATLAPGRRLYAVGDVHGCAVRLTAMHRLIERDLAERPVAEATLVHVGDYIDRGPESAGVLAILAAGPLLPGLRVVNLRGNHEQMMLTTIASGRAESAAQWIANGGMATLESWGVPWRTAPLSRWAATIPAEHIAFLNALPASYWEGPYLFVHAGVRPGVPLERQSRHDLLWIREPFLSWEGDFGAVVVHGHTPFMEPVVRSNRIGIDTGAVLGGRLTCAILEEDRVGFLTA